MCLQRVFAMCVLQPATNATGDQPDRCQEEGPYVRRCRAPDPEPAAAYSRYLQQSATAGDLQHEVGENTGRRLQDVVRRA